MPDLTAEFIKRYQKLQQVTPSEPTPDPKELSKLKDLVQQAKVALKAKAAELEALNNELAEQEQQRVKYQAQLESCTEQFNAQNETIESLQQTIDELRIEIDGKDDDHSDADESAVNSLRAENRELRSKTQKQTTEIEALKGDNKRVWDVNEEYSNTIEEKNRSIKNLQTQLAALSGSPTTNATTNRAPIEGTKEELKARIDKTRDSISQLDRQLSGYGELDLSKVPESRLGDVAAMLSQELQVKQERRGYHLRARNS